MGDEADALDADFDVGANVPCNCPRGKCHQKVIEEQADSVQVWKDKPYCRLLEKGPAR